MSAKVYQDRDWFYYHYVQKRMKLTDIQKLLLEKHGISITPQALYNWAKKHDLLKYRGKGRNLKAHKKMNSATVSPMQQRMAEVRKLQRARMKKRTGR
jgi:hypothetical protein